MPRIIYTPNALLDLVRLRKFLHDKNPEAARRASAVIKQEIEKAGKNPERFRPVPELQNHREIIIDFGASGYIARFRHEIGGDIYIVRVKHQLEDE